MRTRLAHRRQGTSRRRSGSLHLAVLVALGWLGTSAAASPPGASLIVARQVTVSGPRIRLGDVATLAGEASQYADLDLGAAPAPGESASLAGVSILAALGGAGVATDQVRYEIPNAVRVTRAMREFRSEEIRDAVLRDAADLLAPGESARRIEVGAPLRVAPGDARLRVVSCSPTTSPVRRSCEIEAVRSDGSTGLEEVVGRTDASVTVSVASEVVVARKAVPAGAIVGADDVALEAHERGSVAADAASDLADVIGKQAKVALSPGRAVRSAALVEAMAVQRGELVRLRLEIPGMRLAAAGEALEAGPLGARVRVRNRDSKQILVGEVVERGTVVVGN